MPRSQLGSAPLRGRGTAPQRRDDLAQRPIRVVVGVRTQGAGVVICLGPHAGDVVVRRRADRRRVVLGLTAKLPRLAAKLLGGSGGGLVHAGRGDQPGALGLTFVHQPGCLGARLGDQLGRVLLGCRRVPLGRGRRLGDLCIGLARGPGTDLDGFSPGRGEDLVVPSDDPAGLGNLSRQHLTQVVEQVQGVLARDHARTGDGHGASRLDQFDQLGEKLVGPADPLVTRHECARRSSSRSSTTAGTSALTSPPHVAISLTRLDARKLYSGLVGMKRVSTSARPRFIWAI